MDVWKSAMEKLGALFVIAAGLKWIPTWLVDNLDSLDSVSLVKTRTIGVLSLNSCLLCCCIFVAVFH